jgi:virulence-associated protein VagC
MRIKRTDNGNLPELDKAEVRCLLDAKAIIEAADAIQGGDSVTMECDGDNLIVRPLSQEIEVCARSWGAKHFDETGKLKPPVGRKEKSDGAELTDAEAAAIVEEAMKEPDEPIAGLS